MKVSLCTITFRHHLISISEIASFARANDFQGIELWAAHGRNMAQMPERNADWLASLGLSVPMVSDYLPVDADRLTRERQTKEVCGMARRWRAGKIRTFAGNRGSAMIAADERRSIAARLRAMCDMAADFGVDLLVETHPNTLADTAASTLDLIDAVDHPAFAINFDTLHVWEGGDDPVAVHRMMKPHIRHYHLKNIRARSDLVVFEPANVYAAAGRRDGMTPLFQGAVDYMRFLAEIADQPETEVSLEWFGPDCMDVLRTDRREIAEFVERRTPQRLSINF
ncbi:3-dehydroshikimate dehydratase [Pararhizobium antarcticum]|uniref:3-dehydroshikimate dehydratase n=2 Tax=Pararhizobium antarcticum TaxID=1798805 RepID=A0A657M0A5_9HYPH|nr:3-dehydroshikimate dehydratase [Rhizobium sp. 58]OJG01504.1 3-dehydroshikimate dehydratase [Pararhizobium antarcticum]